MYAGGLVGLATLSADARSVISTDEVAASLYEPENGVATNLLVGAHVFDYVTIQGNYIWNRNALTLVSIRTTGTTTSVFEQRRTSTQQMVVGDILVYFRRRGDRVRPYLSAGAGVVRFESQLDQTLAARGTVPPGPTLTDVRATLRIAVGLDLRTGGGWTLRYSFSESLSGNPVSEELAPSGQRNLANFQNLVGVVRSF